jgi:hypothetical protein
MMFYGTAGGMNGNLSKIDELDSELWHACAGPLTTLPTLNSYVMYWPQGHIEQVRMSVVRFFASHQGLTTLWRTLAVHLLRVRACSDKAGWLVSFGGGIYAGSCMYSRFSGC